MPYAFFHKTQLTMKINRLFFLAFPMAALIAAASCEKSNPDPCEGVTCQNGGACLEGKCQCPTGFTGANCETQATPKSVKVTSISIKKYPATKTDGSKWDTDGSAPDLYPAIYTLKADNKSIDQVFWSSNTFSLNPAAGKAVDFSLILPALSLGPVDKTFAIAAIDKDDPGVEVVGTIISFTLNSLITGRPSTISIDCPTCSTGFDLKVEYLY